MPLDKNAITKEAQKFAAKGQFDKAIAEWKKLIKESPNDANIFNTIGDLCLKKNSKNEAVDAYKRAADILAEDGFTSKAIALYKKVLNIDPSVVDVHLALGDMNAEKGLTGNALESYKFAADYYSQKKETAKALTIYQKMADLNSANVAFRIKLADMYAKEGMKAEATKAYLAAADVYLSKDAFKDARQLFEKVLAIDPSNKEVYHNAGVAYFKEGKFVEACRSLRRAHENDPSNADLNNVYLDALHKAGKSTEAEDVLRKLLDGDPGNIGYREKLYHLYAAGKNLEKALGEVSLLADAIIEKGEPARAEELLKGFVSENPDYIHARRKLGEFYFSLNRTDDAVKEFVQAADVLSAAGEADKACVFLNRALEISPDLAEARERIERLSAQEAEPRAEHELSVPEPEQIPHEQPAQPAPEMAVLEPPAPAPAAEESPVDEEDPAINEAMAEVDVLVKYGLAAKAAEELEALTVRFPGSLRVKFKLRDLYAELGDIDKTVEHALGLADLHSARGAREQAEAVLQATEEMAPNHPAILARLGKTPQDHRPQPQPAAPAMPEAASFDLGEQPVQPPSSVPEAMSFDIEEPLEQFSPATPKQDEIDSFPAVGNMTPSPFEETAPPHEPAPVDDIPFEGFDPGVPSPAVDAGEPPLSEPRAPLEEPSLPEQDTFVPDIPATDFDQVPAPEAPADTGPAEVDTSEIWAEAEFYFQQGLFDEAKKHYAKIIGLTPGDRRAIDRLSEIAREAEETQEFSKLADAVDDLESAESFSEAPAEMAMSASDNEAIRSLMQEIQQVKQEEIPESSLAEEVDPPQSTEPPTSEKEPSSEEFFFAPPRHAESPSALDKGTDEQFDRPQKAKGEDFFDLGAELEEDRADAPTAHDPVPESSMESENFFDLASELRDELSSVKVPDQPPASDEEQTLDDIFNEFKKGIEEQAVKEDADTHYNLGVAYKEMGLLDDAIAEFIMTPEDEPKVIQSRYMLGLCYMEKGKYQGAIEEIQNALDYSQNMGIDAHHRIEMYYDLGLAFQGAGNNDRALQEFKKVLDMDKSYRDAADKVKELQQGGLISLDQIKDDIEKEISSKFLEEGERIEREEKHRKNEKVKGSHA